MKDLGLELIIGNGQEGFYLFVSTLFIGQFSIAEGVVKGVMLLGK